MPAICDAMKAKQKKRETKQKKTSHKPTDNESKPMTIFSYRVCARARSYTGLHVRMFEGRADHDGGDIIEETKRNDSERKKKN